MGDLVGGMTWLNQKSQKIVKLDVEIVEREEILGLKQIPFPLYVMKSIISLVWKGVKHYSYSFM